jgi:hypothetical protein
MIERKLIVGRYLDFVIPAIVPAPFAAGALMPFAPMPFTIQESETSGWPGSRRRQSAVVGGANPAPAKVHRNFQWLPYVPGAVTHVVVGAVDVLTGPMSGCELAFLNIGGVQHAAHVGTDVGRPAQNNAVKTTFNGFVATNDVLGRYNPLRDWVGPLPAARAGEQPFIFGLLTAGGLFYTLFTYRANGATAYRIAGLQNPAGAPAPNTALTMEAVP